MSIVRELTDLHTKAKNAVEAEIEEGESFAMKFFANDA